MELKADNAVDRTPDLTIKQEQLAEQIRQFDQKMQLENQKFD